jgi:hypothetical protein
MIEFPQLRGNKVEPLPRSGKLLNRHALSTQFVPQIAPRAWSARGACARCYKNLKHCCQTDIRVQHVVELYADLIEEGRLKIAKDMTETVVYLDGCDLGRHTKCSAPSLAWNCSISSGTGKRGCAVAGR